MMCTRLCRWLNSIAYSTCCRPDGRCSCSSSPPSWCAHSWPRTCKSSIRGGFSASRSAYPHSMAPRRQCPPNRPIERRTGNHLVMVATPTEALLQDAVMKLLCPSGHRLQQHMWRLPTVVCLREFGLRCRHKRHPAATRALRMEFPYLPADVTTLLVIYLFALC